MSYTDLKSMGPFGVELVQRRGVFLQMGGVWTTACVVGLSPCGVASRVQRHALPCDTETV